MSKRQQSLFSAGHGFYEFALSREDVERSLYYNLLLQPGLAIPDHYFLHGDWLSNHLKDYPHRDSWIECGLRNEFITPYFRWESTNLADVHSLMEQSDRRGFGNRATEIAERIDRVPFQSQEWSSASNSEAFGVAAVRYLSEDQPPMLELSVNADEFVGFWTRSRDWIDNELEIAANRSAGLLGSDGLLLSQLLQVAGERVLGPQCGRLANIDELLGRALTEVGQTADQDLRAYFAVLCELYNRSLADTILTAPNSPRWQRHVAAMDLWREEVLGTSRGGEEGDGFDVEIELPPPRHLRSVSGDTFVSIRESPACERYFESLSYWQADPESAVLKGELVESLQRYGREISSQVGSEVGALGLRPQFISKATDLSRVLEKAPGAIQAFLAIGATSTTAATVAAGSTPPAVPATFFSLFILQTVAKYRTPSKRVGVDLTPLDGVRVHADVTISRR